MGYKREMRKYLEALDKKELSYSDLNKKIIEIQESNSVRFEIIKAESKYVVRILAA